MKRAAISAIAAVVLLVAGVASALVVGNDDHKIARSGSTGTTPPTSTTTTVDVGTATGTEPSGPPVSIAPRLIAASRLEPFRTCGGLVDFARAKALEVVTPYGLPGSGGGPKFVMEGRGAMPPASGAERSTAGAAPSAAPQPQSAPVTASDTAGGFSKTNVQEAGVDEPDQVKTDGHRMFAIENGRLWAVSVDGSPRVLGSIALDSAQQLLLVGNRIIALGQSPVAVPMMGGPAAEQSASTSGRSMPYPGPYRYEPQSRITVVDVSDPAAMRVTNRMDADGNYLSARLVGGVARVVLRSTPRGMEFQPPRDDTPAARAEALDHNRQVIRSSGAANWVPGFAVDGGQRVSGCAASYRPPEFSGFGTLTVLTLDAANPERSDSTSVMGDGEIVYASERHLFVATNQWSNVRGDTVESSPRTLIHEFDITSPRQAAYRVSGEVPGTVLNQFSMSEYAGHLRVATTEQDPNGRGNGASRVVVLKDNGQTLGTVGDIGGLGRGERIYAVRFIGDVGYVVTFRQVDPLYTLDLSNPSRPRVVGELKILGYSAYLHPIGPDLLLGVGQDATPEGRTRGTQVSVFDVSDPASPRLLHQRSLGQGQSPAEFDHHAFLYWEPTHLAVVPVNQYNPQFNGAVGLRADRAVLDEVGRVQHPGANPEPPPQPHTEPAGPSGAAKPTSSYPQRYSPPIERSVVVGGRLFTLSASGVLASDLNSLADRGWAPFS